MNSVSETGMECHTPEDIMSSEVIQTNNLSKTYRIHEKPEGFKNTVKDLFSRKYIDKKAVNDLSFNVTFITHNKTNLLKKSMLPVCWFKS